ncbi:hypothetical protein ACQKGD_29595 [Peribacillus frigoritolerans]|uniref:hypothetical protein n=1 Tax=Peribacillus frigoritolerans TaxID=450367 RepID=UPI003D065733
MYVYHPAFEKPNDSETKVWRYMDFTKFVNLLANSTLFFNRADKFRDTFEGSFPSSNKELAPVMYDDLEPEQIEILIADSRLFNEKLRERTVISCWHLNEFESAAMWDLYLKNNEGIAIQTTFNSLSESFNETDEEIFIGKVNYIDFDKDWMPEGYVFYPFVHKRKSFEHEKEIRALLSIFPEPNLKSPFEFGANIKVNLDLLIENIYIHPDAPRWFAETVKSVLKAYNVDKPVIHSNLYGLPK